MKKKRFAAEQIVAILKQAELGIPIAELIRQVGVSEQTFYRWKKKYSGLEVDQVRLRSTYILAARMREMMVAEERWMEPVGRAYLLRPRLTPDVANGAIRLTSARSIPTGLPGGFYILNAPAPPPDPFAALPGRAE
jgi:putative transposase